MPKTLFDKIWERHEVRDGLLYIDLHLVHEVTSPQAFESLRLAGPQGPPAGPHAGHGRPQRAHRRRHHARRRSSDQLSRKQVEPLERTARSSASRSTRSARTARASST